MHRQRSSVIIPLGCEDRRADPGSARRLVAAAFLISLDTWHLAAGPLLALGLRGDRGRAFWIGWFGGLGYFSGTLHWIAEPFLVQPEIFGWMIPFAVTAMAGGMALFWGAGFWVARRICTQGWGAPFALAFGLAGMEWLRGNILSGFPWSLIGYAWIETDAIQAASVVGVYGLTLWTVLVGCLLGGVVVASGLAQRGVFAVVAAGLLLAPFLFALERLQTAASRQRQMHRKLALFSRTYRSATSGNRRCVKRICATCSTRRVSSQIRARMS